MKKMIRSKDELQYYLRQDKLALGYTNKKISSFLFPNEIYKFEKVLRHLEYYENTPSFIHKIRWIITKIRYKRLSLKLGFSIPTNVFGPGLSIAHYGTIIVNPNTRIGANCRLHAGVNIGASAGSTKAPTLGDNIYIGPGAILFGDIKIVNNITIGANATVNKSFNTEFCAIAGNPAKIVKQDMPNWLQFNNKNIQ